MQSEKENIIVKNEREGSLTLDPLALPTSCKDIEEESSLSGKLPEKLTKFGPNTIFDKPWQD